MKIRFDMYRQVASIFCIAAGMAMAGCEGSPVGHNDYRLRHPITAQKKVFSLIIPVSVSGQADNGLHLQRIKRFAAGYLRRGRGPLLVSHGSGTAASRENQSMIADALAEAGVPTQSIYFQIRAENHPGRNNAELSYAGYSVRVPTCGDWSGAAGFDPNNRSHTDFGCSVQRNTGLMLSDPADLSVAGEAVDRDSQTSDRVIREFREGKSIGTPVPKNEQKDFSDIKGQ